MVTALGVLVAAFVVVLLVGIVTGRARVSTCCQYVPPEQDPRLRVQPTPRSGP